MKGKQLRSFMVNEKEMIFNVHYFQELFVKFASKKNMGIGSYEYEVAEALYVDKSTIHNWRMNVNGPGDIEKIQTLATFWNINYENLLMEVEDMTTTERTKTQQLMESEKIALRNVYKEFLDFMETFNESYGFKYVDTEAACELTTAYVLYERLKFVLKSEYIDLKRTVYDKLDEFFNGELSMTLEGDFSEEESMEQLTADVEAMYERMMDSFKEIVDEYLV